MSVYLACYCTREDIRTATDIMPTADYNRHIDSAIESAREDVDRLCMRRFFNVDEVRSWDWPLRHTSWPTPGGSGSTRPS